MKRLRFIKNQREKSRMFSILLVTAVYVFTGLSSTKASTGLVKLEAGMENAKADEGQAAQKLSEKELSGERKTGSGDGNSEKDQEDKKKSSETGKWKSRNQKFFYYEGGKKVKGIKVINKKSYYFDSKGIQRTGWQKIDGNYYFFKTANEAKGYMARSETVNGITLAASGKAKLTSESKKKLDILVTANGIVEKAAQPAMTKSEKLRKSFDYLIQHYQYRGSPVFQNSAHWEQDYAARMFREGHGSCYEYGAAFAFLANAAGYKNCYAVSSGGHGWAEAGGKVYDPAWAQIDTRHDYFGVSFELSGVGGRPNYRRARKYVVKI